MARVSKAIPNLLNGVSQQPDTMRLPSQGELQENCIASVVEGLGKRPPTTHLGVMDATGFSGSPYLYLTDYGTNDRYYTCLFNGSLRMFNASTGAELAVASGVTPYFNLQNGETDLLKNVQCVTGNQITYVINKTQTPTYSGLINSARGAPGTSYKQYLVNVLAGTFSTDYTVVVTYTVSGVTTTYTSVKTTSASSATDIRTTQIATDLAANFTPALPADITATVKNSCVLIKLASSGKNNGFTVAVADSKGNTQLVAISDTVQRFTDLPSTCLDTFNTVKVVGDGVNLVSPYYVKFTPFNGKAGEMTTGVWVETLSDLSTTGDIRTSLGYFPYAINKDGAGGFTVSAPVSQRLVGDDTSAPAPSLTNFNDIALFKGRMVLAGGDHLCMSRAGAPTNWFPSTVTAVLDNAPIDIQATDGAAPVFRYVVPFNEDLWIFGDRAQLKCTGAPVLTSKTISIQRTTGFDVSPYCKPILADSHLYFTRTGNGYSGIYEYFIDVQNFSYDAADITKHVDKYIPSNIFHISASSTTGTIVALSTGDRSSMWVYRYFWSGQDKVQSCWSKFTFGTGVTIHAADFVGADLLLVIQRPSITLADTTVVPGGVHLETMNFASGQVDANSTYLTYLDRRLTEASCAPSYNSVTDRTTWTLPYRIAAASEIRVRSPGAGNDKAGQIIPTTLQDNFTMQAQGNHASTPVYIGQKYIARYRFSKQHLKQETGGGGTEVNTSGILRMRKWRINYSNSVYFTVTVTPDNGATSTYTFLARNVGGPEVLGTLALESGTFAFPIMARNDRVTVEIQNDSAMPCWFTSADWEAEYTSTSQRV